MLILLSFAFPNRLLMRSSVFPMPASTFRFFSSRSSFDGPAIVALEPPLLPTAHREPSFALPVHVSPLLYRAPTVLPALVMFKREEARELGLLLFPVRLIFCTGTNVFFWSTSVPRCGVTLPRFPSDFSALALAENVSPFVLLISAVLFSEFLSEANPPRPSVLRFLTLPSAAVEQLLLFALPANSIFCILWVGVISRFL